MGRGDGLAHKAHPVGGRGPAHTPFPNVQMAGMGSCPWTLPLVQKHTHVRHALRGLPLTPPGLKRPNAPGQASAIHRNRTTGVISNFSSSRIKMKQGKLILILCFVTPVYPNSILSLVIHEIRNG